METFDEEVPKWDIALAALATEAFKKKGSPLNIADFLSLAREHSIRFDDIMVTMFELCIQDEWHYAGPNGEITRESFNELYINGRLDEDDVKAYSGGWAPA
ncbi:MAG: hypothetical protein GXP10_07775 [Gammaproteobacteria bacterium]|nr:hypothetical protein [Gammaproteobacteria bacterium]